MPWYATSLTFCVLVYSFVYKKRMWLNRQHWQMICTVLQTLIATKYTLYSDQIYGSVGICWVPLKRSPMALLSTVFFFKLKFVWRDDKFLRLDRDGPSSSHQVCNLYIILIVRNCKRINKSNLIFWCEKFNIHESLLLSGVKMRLVAPMIHHLFVSHQFFWKSFSNLETHRIKLLSFI